MQGSKTKILPFYRDANKLLKGIRQKDYEELYAAAIDEGLNCKQQINNLASQSKEAYSVFYDNELLCCCGVVENDKQLQTGIMWLLSTGVAYKATLSYYKAAEQFINRFLKICPGGLFTYIACDYEESIRTARHFKFLKVYEEAVDIGGKKHYIYFRRR